MNSCQKILKSYLNPNVMCMPVLPTQEAAAGGSSVGPAWTTYQDPVLKNHKERKKTTSISTVFLFCLSAFFFS
jgi:hypothetical protein